MKQNGWLWCGLLCRFDTRWRVGKRAYHYRDADILSAFACRGTASVGTKFSASTRDGNS